MMQLDMWLLWDIRTSFPYIYFCLSSSVELCIFLKKITLCNLLSTIGSTKKNFAILWNCLKLLNYPRNIFLLYWAVLRIFWILNKLHFLFYKLFNVCLWILNMMLYLFHDVYQFSKMIFLDVFIFQNKHLIWMIEIC